MNVCSPTYIPTCVMPPPGWAANRRTSPGCRASMSGVTSVPEPIKGFHADGERGDRPPLHAGANRPERGELLRGRIGRHAERDTCEGVRSECRAAPPRV